LNIVEEFGGRSGSGVGFGSGIVELWRYGDIQMDLGAEEKADVTVWAATHD